jgi:glycosyltransferase involved in cell wall biosynthesis
MTENAHLIDVVLPVLDEAQALPLVIAGLPSNFVPIVVDNGSTDGSGGIARELGAKVVDEPRRGFGAACWAGLSAATNDVVCFMDCDGSFRGEDLVEVAAPVVDRRVDLVLGARHGTAGWPLHARLANRALAFELRRRTGVRFTDLGPMRAARRVDLLALGIEDRRSGWPLEMVLRAARAGWRIEERNVQYAPRIGRSKVTGTVSGTVRAVHDMAGVLR